MENNYKLDDYEVDLLQSIEGGEWLSVENIEQRRAEVSIYAQNTLANMRKIEIEIEINNNDWHDILVKSAQMGIPYKQLLSAVLHGFASGKFDLKLQSVA